MNHLKLASFLHIFSLTAFILITIMNKHLFQLVPHKSWYSSCVCWIWLSINTDHVVRRTKTTPKERHKMISIVTLHLKVTTKGFNQSMQLLILFKNQHHIHVWSFPKNALTLHKAAGKMFHGLMKLTLNHLGRTCSTMWENCTATWKISAWVWGSGGGWGGLFCLWASTERHLRGN